MTTPDDLELARRARANGLAIARITGRADPTAVRGGELETVWVDLLTDQDGQPHVSLSVVQRDSQTRWRARALLSGVKVAELVKALETARALLAEAPAEPTKRERHAETDKPHRPGTPRGRTAP